MADTKPDKYCYQCKSFVVKSGSEEKYGKCSRITRVEQNPDKDALVHPKYGLNNYESLQYAGTARQYDCRGNWWTERPPKVSRWSKIKNYLWSIKWASNPPL